MNNLKNKIEGAINQKAFMQIKNIISPTVDIVGLQVKGRWLCAILDSGVAFSVRNQDNYLKQN